MKLEAVLAAVSRMTLEDRVIYIGTHQMRLESAKAPGKQGNKTPYWMLDLVKLRFENGPGKVSRKDALQGFKLNANEGFGELTSALYDPTTGYILIQYNHHGPRAGAIAQYFTHISPPHKCAFEFHVRLDETAEARLESKSIITKLHYKVAGFQMSKAMKSGNVSLDRSLDLSDSLGGQSIEVIISAGKGRLQTKPTRAVINSLMELLTGGSAKEQSAVETFKVYAKEDYDDATDEINLISSKMEQSIDGLKMGEDHMYTVDSRWLGLQRARNGWDDAVTK
jgi:hypothetical protein